MITNICFIKQKEEKDKLDNNNKNILIYLSIYVHNIYLHLFYQFKFK